MNRTIAAVLLVALALLIIVTVAILGPGTAGAADLSPGSSPSASPTPTATATPADPGLVQWALGRRAAARKALAKWNRARSCFDLASRRLRPQAPPRTADAETWRAAGSRWKANARDWRDRFGRLRAKMRRPGGAACGEKWKPLALWVGFTRSEWPTVLFIMAKRGGTGESGGCPGALNERSGCAGLMQLHPKFYRGVWKLPGIRAPFDPFIPENNLEAAEALQDVDGWDPWAL